MSIRDRVSFLHDETNTLLKTKYLLDTKTDALVDRMEKKKEVLVGLKQLYVDAHATAQATAFLQPGEPVISRYGYGYILAHRGSDDMLQVGDPPRYCCIIYHPVPYPILTLSSPNLFYPMLQLLPLLVLLYSYRIIYHPILSSPKPLLPFATGHPAVL